MCLDLTGDSKKQIATEDIVCYKWVNIDYNQNIIIQYQGKSFTGIIDNVECEGVIQVEHNDVYLCTNNYNLDGDLCKDKLGYQYSWAFDDNVQSLIIDGINVMSIKNCIYFKTPYQYAEVKLGETYTSKLILNGNYTIDIGLHSFVTYEDAKYNCKYGVIVKCIIPKGSEYYLGEFGEYDSYASNQLKYLEIVTE